MTTQTVAGLFTGATRQIPRTMARRRATLGRPVMCGVIAGMLVVAGLAAAIFLGNQVTRARSEIGALTRERTALITRHAVLTARWNETSSRLVVVDRACRELGMINPDDPGQVLVMVTPNHHGGGHLWRRVLRNVGGGDAVAAATAGVERP